MHTHSRKHRHAHVLSRAGEHAIARSIESLGSSSGLLMQEQRPRVVAWELDVVEVERDADMLERCIDRVDAHACVWAGSC